MTMRKKTKNTLTAVVIVLVVGGGIWFLATRPRTPGRLDAFAQCIKDSGTIFYGAFWCPHCQNEKALFGNSADLLPYVECSMPDGQSQTPICIQKNIESYPTFEFKDGSRLTGEVSLEDLAQKTGCKLPQ